MKTFPCTIDFTMNNWISNMDKWSKVFSTVSSLLSRHYRFSVPTLSIIAKVNIEGVWHTFLRCLQYVYDWPSFQFILNFFILAPCQGHRVDNVYPSYHCAKDVLHPGSDSSPSHGPVWDKQPCTLTLTSKINVDSPVNKTLLFLYCERLPNTNIPTSVLTSKKLVTTVNNWRKPLQRGAQRDEFCPRHILAVPGLTLSPH